MPSPPRPVRGSPPRQALHERSESQTNERSLRLVGEPQAPIYGSPLPTKSSQILSPQIYDGPAPTVGAQAGVFPFGQRLPQESEQNVDASSTLARSAATKRGSSIKQSDNSSNKRYSFTSTSRFVPATNGPDVDNATSPTPLSHTVEEEGRVSDDIVQLPSVSPKRDVREAYNLKTPAALEHQPVQTKDSESSLSSTNSTGTVILKKKRDGKKRASYSAFPNVARLGSSKSNSSLSTTQKLASTDANGQSLPESPASSGSPILDDPIASAARRTSSAPMSANIQARSQSPVTLQYPTIRSPSASASWVKEESSSASNRLERYHDRWNPHLSTVQSEGTGSQSEARTSQSMWLPDSSRVSKSSSMALNGRGSSDLPIMPTSPVGEGSMNASRLQIPPQVHSRDITSSTIRVVSEQEDTITNLQPIPGSRDSEHLGQPPVTGAKRNSMMARPSSRASFFRDSIPAWAKWV